MIKLLTSKCLLLISFVTILAFSSKSQDCKCNHTISLTDEIIDGAKLNVKPGDKVCLQAGLRKSLWLSNFNGTPEKPVIIVNCGGQVVISNKDKWGISISYSKNFKLLGNGDSNFKYGIKVDGVATVGLSFNRLTTDFETAFVEVYKSLGPGCMAKSDPECGKPETWRGNFVMRNVNIHNYYIHEVGTKAAGGEGFYIGHSFFNGIDRDCGKLFPHNIENVKVHDNVIENTAFDGMQVSCAVSGAEVYNNVIKNYGTVNNGGQQGGLIVGGGSKGKFYNNFIHNGTGAGITVFGQGDIFVFNNVVSNPGQEGIFFDDRSTDPNLSFHFWNNTILNAKTNGITIYSAQSKLNTLYNNLIINPGNWPKFGDIRKGFIYLENFPGKVVKYDTSNNYFCKDMASAQFIDPNNLNFRLKSTSPAVDRGADLTSKGVTFDLENKKRPAGKAFDIGAYESGAIVVTPSPLTIETSVTNATCYGSSTGTASVVASGGTAPYTYSWSNGKATQKMEGIPAGNYTVTVKDQSGSMATSTIKVGQSTDILVTFSKTDETSASKGAINITVTGGTAPYSYSWSNSAITEDVANLVAGTYTVTATDIKSCKKVVSIVIIKTPESEKDTIMAGTYNVISKKSGRYLDIPGSALTSQTNVIIWDPTNAPNQQFRISPTTDGYYSMIAAHSDKAVDVTWGGTVNGTGIWQYTPNGTDAQKWKIESVGNGYYKIVSKKSGRALGVKDGSVLNGGLINIWDYLGEDHQIWKLQSVAATTTTTKAKREGDVINANGALTTLDAFPNPVTSDKLNLKIISSQETQAEISIVNSVAQKQLGAKHNLKIGTNQIEIPVGHLKGGMHLLIVNKGKERLVKKLIIVR